MAFLDPIGSTVLDNPLSQNCILHCKMEPWYNKVPGDWENVFIVTGVHYKRLCGEMTEIFVVLGFG